MKGSFFDNVGRIFSSIVYETPGERLKPRRSVRPAVHTIKPVVHRLKPVARKHTHKAIRPKIAARRRVHRPIVSKRKEIVRRRPPRRPPVEARKEIPPMPAPWSKVAKYKKVIKGYENYYYNF
ncbi:MAG: hypothetical protein V1735_05640 [Nanoarchaeota archaeon]